MTLLRQHFCEHQRPGKTDRFQNILTIEYVFGCPLCQHQFVISRVTTLTTHRNYHIKGNHTENINCYQRHHLTRQRLCTVQLLLDQRSYVKSCLCIVCPVVCREPAKMSRTSCNLLCVVLRSSVQLQPLQCTSKPQLLAVNRISMVAAQR